MNVPDHSKLFLWGVKTALTSNRGMVTKQELKSINKYFSQLKSRPMQNDCLAVLSRCMSKENTQKHGWFCQFLNLVNDGLHRDLTKCGGTHL